ncbi:hypothetical protein M0R45_017785 [Rubus argutus]|uniref:Mediator complex subunit 15 KIX domain-containing protein n=1 Tax=Rubus argutus TaxID=59490 RepID=A0AAW1XX59_RUBAR
MSIIFQCEMPSAGAVAGIIGHIGDNQENACNNFCRIENDIHILCRVEKESEGRTDVLKRNPYYGQVGLQELERIAATFEEKIYNVASSQSDYLRKISLKMLTVETQIAATASNHSLDLESLFASLDLQD